MLRNAQQTIWKNINNQHKLFHHHHHPLCSKNTSNVFRQGKIMGKLYGNRVAGSKKRWIPLADTATSSNVIFKQSPFGGKSTNTSGGGKNASRRMHVLNKLFMTHITDLMATGEISESILGKGLQVSRVKISQDFAFITVFWLTTGDVGKDVLLEHELQNAAGLLRHELSQLNLIGSVPRIKFVKDRMLSNIGQVEALLKNMDFGEDDENSEEHEDYKKNATDVVKREFYGNKPTNAYNNEPVTENGDTADKVLALKAKFKLPEMRHDVLDLDHKGIMLKIATKMRKSKQAWEQHQQQSLNCNPAGNTEQISPTNPTSSQLNRINMKLTKAAENSKAFEDFLAKRRERKNTPERKKYRATDHVFDGSAIDDDREYEVMSPHQRHLYEAEDFLYDDLDDKKKL